MRETQPPTVVMQHSSMLEVTLVAAGAAIGWFLAMAAQTARRQASAAALPPPPPPRAAAASGSPGTWKNGAMWSNLVSFNIANRLDDLTAGATLDDIKAIQTQTLESAQDAHAFASDQFTATQDPRYSYQAIAINDKQVQFDTTLNAMALSLVGGDISSLKNSGDRLMSVGAELPNATNKITAIDGYLNVFSQLISLI